MATKGGHTEVPGGHKFPPLQTETYVSQILWLAIAFVALYLLMSRIALPRVGSILEERRTRIEGDLAAAQKLKDESDAALAGYEKALAEARGRAQTLTSKMHEKEAAEAEALRKDVDAQLGARIAEAEHTIAETRRAAMANVRTIAVEAAAAIVERLIGSAPAADDVATAVNDVLRR